MLNSLHMYFWPLLGHDFLFIVFDFSVVGIDLLNICCLMAKVFFDVDVRIHLLVLFSFFGGACDFEFLVIYLICRYYYFLKIFEGLVVCIYFNLLDICYRHCFYLEKEMYYCRWYLVDMRYRCFLIFFADIEFEVVLSDSVVSFIVVVVLRILLHNDLLEVESELNLLFDLFLVGVPILVLINVSELLEDEFIVE